MSGNAEGAPRKRNFRFYRAPGSDRVVAREELEGLEVHGRAALVEAIGRFRVHQERRGEVKKLKGTDDLWEIRVKVAGDPFRAIFFYDSDVVVVCVTAFFKNQQQTPKQDLDRAATRKKIWEAEGARRREVE